MSKPSQHHVGVFFSSTIAVVLLCATLVFAFSSSAFIGFTGAPGEGTCGDCHVTLPVNGGPGDVVLYPSQSTYFPGDTIDFFVNIYDPGQRLWAFQVTVLDRSNEKIGLLRKTDTTTVGVALDPQSGRNYVESSRFFRYPGMLDSALGYRFSWVAPDSIQGPATFYAVGYAGNLDSLKENDNIYTTARTIPMSANCCTDERDYIDCTAGLDVLDVTVLVDHLFIGFGPVCCEQAADLNNDTGVDILDLTILVDHLFISFAPVSPCL